MEISLDFNTLRKAYNDGLSPDALINSIYDRIDQMGTLPIWISLVPRDSALEWARNLKYTDRANLPLFGVPFAVKDNIDIEGQPTTAGCPAYSYNPPSTAAVVRRLIDAGAILIGKTNLDQFATGLVGTRSPYGICSSVFNPEYISGGSSSGSAVATASGLVSFALGTDTAGSGRVPAAFNNIVGLKPTKGAISTRGVVPACKSLDCISVFALTCADAAGVLDIAGNFTDAPSPWLNSSFRFGIPESDQLEFFGDEEARRLYDQSVERMVAVGGEPTTIDFQPFKDAAALLYTGPWVAERLAAIETFIAEHAADMEPVVQGIIAGAKKYSAVDSFNAQYKLEVLRQAANNAWKDADILLLPTTGTIYKINDVLADPVQLNTNLGCYTNFVNLLDLAAVAIPADFRSNGLPFGVTVIGKAGTDRALLAIADRLDRVSDRLLGGLKQPLSSTQALDEKSAPPGCTLIAVVGAHLTGQPLNHQLTGRGARLAYVAKSVPEYRLYALRNTTPEKPGLVKSPGFVGPGIDLEVWAIPTINFGSFVAEIPNPLGIGTIELAGGERIKGFICEPYAIEQATEITQLGGWRNYLAAKKAH